MQTQEEINKKMEECMEQVLIVVDKTGDNQVLKFYIETVNDEFLPQDAENMLKRSLEKIFEIIFNPYLENGVLKRIRRTRKRKFKTNNRSKIDNQSKICFRQMYRRNVKNEPFGLYKYGYVEDLKDINEKNLYEYYLELIETCKIDIYVSGIVDENMKI